MLRGSLESLLAARALPNQYAVTLEEALNEADRVIHCTRSMIELMEPEPSSQFEIVSVSGLAREIIDWMHPVARSLGLRLDFLCEEDLYVHANPRRLSRALIVVIQNALQASPKGSRVGVSVFRRDKDACITVCDEGPNFSSRDSRRLFQPSFRDDPDTQQRQGEVLDLAIAKKIIDAHEGSIRVDNHCKLGKSICILLEHILPEEEPNDGNRQLQRHFTRDARTKRLPAKPGQCMNWPCAYYSEYRNGVFAR